MIFAEVQTLFQEGLLGIRLIWKLSSYLKKTIQPSQARAIIRYRLEQREKDFINLVKKCIYDQPKSPYLNLLKNAGCEYRDLQNLVHKEGVEGTLHMLFRKGVYLTLKEFRGDCETVRGNTRLLVNPRQLRNPLAKRHIPVRSSGSRSHGIQVVRDLDFLHDNTVALVVFLEARKSLSSELATWSVPGGVTLSNLTKFNCAGLPPSRWFSQFDTRAREISFRYRMSARVLELSGILAGTPMPQPEYVSLDNPLPIIQWIKDCLQRGRTPHLFTFVSSAVRLAQCALDANIDLQGTQITMSGEPITPARLATVRRSHADALPSMGCVEVGHIGYGCLTPEAPDDIHLLKDLHAVTQPGKIKASSDLTPHTLLFSSLRLSSPLILLNVSLGDQALLKNKSCGCPLGNLGLNTHLQHIRSFEKLTSGGMALLDTEIIRVLEEELPKRFGGGPTDYQLLEDESEEGKPHVRLVVHPRIGPLDEGNVKETFLCMIGSGSGAEKLTSLVWRDANMVTIERGTPRATATGKIQHMHIKR